MALYSYGPSAVSPSACSEGLSAVGVGAMAPLGEQRGSLAGSRAVRPSVRAPVHLCARPPACTACACAASHHTYAFQKKGSTTQVPTWVNRLAEIGAIASILFIEPRVYKAITFYRLGESVP